jgi:hypothetical protein
MQKEIHTVSSNLTMLYYLKRCLQAIKKDEKGGTCSTHGGDEKCIKMLVGRPEGERPLDTQRRT